MNEEYNITEENQQPKKKNPAFKWNFWIALAVTILAPLLWGLFDYHWEIVRILSGFFICTVLWIIYLAMRKQGAHGWIAGTLTAIAGLLLMFGSCIVLLSKAI